MRYQQMMIRAVVLGALSPLTAVALQPPARTGEMNAAMAVFKSGKAIKFNVRNDSPENVELRDGERLIKVAPGQTVALALPPGERVTFDKATAKHAAGDVLVQAESALSDATVVIH